MSFNFNLKHIAIVFFPLLIGTLVACTNTGSVSQGNVTAQSEKECGDLLKQFGTTPDQLEFVECSPAHAPQVASIARYRVPGAQAGIVEDFLNKEYGMNSLQFVCCGWEPKEGVPGSLTVPGHYFSISMHSEETLMNDRTKWSELPFFYVDVEELINI